ncbi:interleukin 17a/f1 [Cynoglossus semilaevis]|uniref:Interleukin 17F n=1 Tax=Cynoglossus semilaevis TaxID=244447 RepID=A0A3P8WUJ7_CYNSE|nr:interleukin-17F [Cynoglossus semilaevis]
MSSTVDSTLRAASVCTILMVMVLVETTATSNTIRSLKPKKKSASAPTETVPLQLDNRSLVLNNTIRSLENCSISPWSYNVSKDDSLFPQLMEAQCLLEGCLDSQGIEDRNLKSTAIIQQVLVLRRMRSNSTEHSYYFKLESRLMAVGCTCVRSIVQHQQ